MFNVTAAFIARRNNDAGAEVMELRVERNADSWTAQIFDHEMGAPAMLTKFNGRNARALAKADDMGQAMLKLELVLAEANDQR